MATRDSRDAVVQDQDVTSPDELDEFDRAASTEVTLDRPVAEAAATARDITQWPNWFPMHAGWSAGPPAELEVGTSFGQQIKVMGIPAEIEWTVARADDTSVRLDGSGRVGVTMSVFLDVIPDGNGSRIRLALGIGGDAARGPMGASVQRAAQEAIDAAGRALAAVVDGNRTQAPATGPIRHERTGVELDPRTPVLVGAGQLVQREPTPPFRDPVALSVAALRAAAETAAPAPTCSPPRTRCTPWPPHRGCTATRPRSSPGRSAPGRPRRWSRLASAATARS